MDWIECDLPTECNIKTTPHTGFVIFETTWTTWTTMGYFGINMQPSLHFCVLHLVDWRMSQNVQGVP